MRNVPFVAGLVLAVAVLMGQGKPATPPATQPATQPVKFVFTLDLLYAGMPENLRPEPSESSLKKQARTDWLRANVFGKNMGPWELSGTIFDIRSVNLSDGSHVQVLFVCRTSYFGQRRDCMVTATLAVSGLDAALDWKKGMPITAKGSLLVTRSTAAITDDGEVSTSIQMVGATAEVNPPQATTKPATTAPARRGGR